MKTISILGSTGSIGKQALDIVSLEKQNFVIDYIYADSDYAELFNQIKQFSPKFACINNKNSYNKLVSLLGKKYSTKIILGEADTLDLISTRDVDLVINGIVGIKGLKPSIAAINNNTDIALSNKESLVLAGHILTSKAKENKVNIFPVDSEHSALWQCLVGESIDDIKKLILTASGGPFRELDVNKFSNITVEEALNHPNWAMGNKITIDSATMMNKGFEVIETFWLFNIDYEKIDIVVHPQSIIHSMVEFNDTSVKAQLGLPDMRVPINYAINFPKHTPLNIESLDLTKIKDLTFEKPDLEKFKCIQLAYDSLKTGGSSTAVLNISNDMAVELFLTKQIQFNDIPKLIEMSLEKHCHINSPTLEDIDSLVDWTHSFIRKEIA